MNVKNVTGWIVVLIVLGVIMIMMQYGYIRGLSSNRLFRTSEEPATGLTSETARSGAEGRSRPSQSNLPTSAMGANMQLAYSQESYSNAVATVRPSVVNVSANGTRSQRNMMSLGTGVQFDYPVSGSTEQSVGSGVIIDSRGYILTNYHVIAGGTDVRVTTFGYQNNIYVAQVVNTDIERDLAVLKIDADRPLPTARLGNSAMAEVGDVVLAIGSPYGLEQTVTLGIVSDDKRTLVIDGRIYEDMIQTDAAINKGNSGGPLININGEIIGINTAIYAPTGVFNGLGFVIPINHAKTLIMQATHLP